MIDFKDIQWLVQFSFSRNCPACIVKTPLVWRATIPLAQKLRREGGWGKSNNMRGVKPHLTNISQLRFWASQSQSQWDSGQSLQWMTCLSLISSVYVTSSNWWLGTAGEHMQLPLEMWSMRTTFIIISQKALLVPVSTKGITVDHERGIEQHSKQDSYLIQRFYLQLLSYNQSVNGEELGQRAASKDTTKTIMCDNNSQAEKFTVLLFNRLFNLHSMTKGHWDAIETNEKA